MKDSTSSAEVDATFMERSVARRAQAIRDEMRQIMIDAEHWNSLHPDEEPIVIEPITEAEIAAYKAADGKCGYCGGGNDPEVICALCWDDIHVPKDEQSEHDCGEDTCVCLPEDK